MYNSRMDLHLKQISKVVYEAIRAYDVTIGKSEPPTWEAAPQSDRDEIMKKVDALLSGKPHAPVSIRPSDQVKAKLLAGIVGAFVQVYHPPVVAPVFVPPAPPVPAIPVQTFPNPDEEPHGVEPAPATSFEQVGDVGPVENQPAVEDPANVDEALARADAHIGEGEK